MNVLFTPMERDTLSIKRDKTSLGLGAHYLGAGRCSFCLWAPYAERVDLTIVEPYSREIVLEPSALGYHFAVTEGVFPGPVTFFGSMEPGNVPIRLRVFSPKLCTGLLK